jgi:hypothetical protein
MLTSHPTIWPEAFVENANILGAVTVKLVTIRVRAPNEKDSGSTITSRRLSPSGDASVTDPSREALPKQKGTTGKHSEKPNGFPV